jgi:hypothetical protein
MDKQRAGYIAAGIIVAIVIFIFATEDKLPVSRQVLEFIGLRDSSPCPKPQPKKATIPVCKEEACVLYNETMNPNHLFSEQWQLSETDHGAFTFMAQAPTGGLVIYLADSPNNREAKGYAIVLDDQDKSYVGKLPHFVMVDNRHSQSKINKGFKVKDDTMYWVIYSKGTVLIGEGTDTGKGKLITCIEGDVNAPQGLKYFGFGAIRKEERGIMVKDIKTYDAPEGRCSWLTMTPHQCSHSDPMAKMPEMYDQK